MQPEIVGVKKITLVGMSFYGDPFDAHSGWDEENQIGHLWKRFMRFLSQHGEAIQKSALSHAAYEVHIYNEETREKGLFEVFVGLEVEDISIVPVELLVKVLPATQYAVFTFTGEQITADWEKILEQWLVSSGYQSPTMYNFQYYDERFKGLDHLAESTLDVYVPIMKMLEP